MKADQCSRSNAHLVQIKELDWTVDVDFSKQVLYCTAVYTLSLPTKELLLDTNHLQIESVCDSKTGSALPFTVLPAIPDKLHLGRPLVITSGDYCDPFDTVQVKYQTTKDGTALQWMTPAQTTYKQYPFLYSQCQAIHARSLVPCQDVTGVKFIYTATVTTPAWATPVLSALLQRTEIVAEQQQQKRKSTFRQPVPISSYLLALCVGQLEKRTLSERCSVYCEPSLADACQYEFAETETFLQTAEAIAGTPYMWSGRYDMLCLPSSFAYGGMENPNLTTITPTLLAGDQSLAGVVAHEISHSYTGNYVTCQTWDDFWLNEGWTVWLERKIAGRLHGAKTLDFEAIGGLADLQDAVNEMPEEFTSLVLPIKDMDPDDAYSSIAYEKGFNFLMYLERLVGEKEFEAFFQAYIREFASSCLTSDDFREFVIRYFSKDSKSSAKIAQVDWDAWFHGKGMPPVSIEYDRSLAEEAELLAQLWVKVDRLGATLPVQDVTNWSSGQFCCFLDALLGLTASEPLSSKTIKSMDELYSFKKTKNCEILLRFCRLAIAAEDESILNVVVRFVTSQGRMKYTRPLYKALFASKMGKDVAVETFLKTSDFYSPVCAKMLASDLQMKRDENKGLMGIVKDKRKALLVSAALACGAAVLMTLLRKRR